MFGFLCIRFLSQDKSNNAIGHDITWSEQHDTLSSSGER